MVELKNVQKFYDKKKPEELALKGVDLIIEDGQMVAIMGPSGSGKSTLLKIIGGMERLSTGKYYFNEIEIDSLSDTELQKFIRNNISFVFQNFALLKDYTVSENVALPLKIKKVPGKLRKQTVTESLEKLGIAHLKNKYPDKISGGEAQRCAIARSLASGNQLVLADEPTGALDIKNSIDTINELRKLNELGRTVIIVTHNSEVAKMCDRVVFLEDGKIVKDGKLEKNYD